MASEDEEDKELLRIRIETLKTMIGNMKKKKPIDSENNHILASNSSTQLPSTAGSSSQTKFSWSVRQSIHQKSDRYRFNKAFCKSHSDSEVMTHKNKQNLSANSGQKCDSEPNRMNKYKLDKRSPAKLKDNVNVHSSKPVNALSIPIIFPQRKPTHSKFRFVKNTSESSESTHRKVPARKAPSVSVQVAGGTNDVKDQIRSKVSSAYKFVRKDSIGEKVNPQHVGRNSYVWVKKNGPVTSKQLQAVAFGPSTSSHFMNDRDSFIRRRFNVVRKTGAMSTKYRKVSLTPTQMRVAKSFHKKNESFSIRRLRYVKTASPALKVMKKRKEPAHFAGPSNLHSPNKNVILSRHGTHFQVANNFKSLRRLGTNVPSNPKVLTAKKINLQTKYKFHRANISSTSVVKRKVASQVIKKSLNLVQRKKVNKTKYCLFYSRFGKCKRGDKCKFIHDPDKIAVCTRFLRGTCNGDGCVYSHKVDPKKMPVCSYFLLGQCSKDNCAYRHVNVGESAAVCEDFLKGYCPREEKCTRQHVLDCVEFSKTGKCRLGKSCTMLHRMTKKIARRRRSSSFSGARKPKAFRRKLRPTTAADDGDKSKTLVDSPLKNKANLNLLPNFISAKINSTSSQDSTAGIRPSLSVMRNLFNAEHENQTGKPEPTPDTEQDLTSEEKEILNISSSDVIPVNDPSSSDSKNMSEGIRRKRRFSFPEQDFIALE